MLASPPDIFLYRDVSAALFIAWSTLLGGFDSADYMDVSAVALPREHRLMVFLFILFTFVINGELITDDRNFVTFGTGCSSSSRRSLATTGAH